ncbi:MAG: DNA polymerase III subunit beta [Solobacterium sp.]|jgi:DNA polymerase-3 subunit beta|nr:DNA polymerase III subunit beta [Solobacterium sp.]MCH4048996.1 DNA polymerase III subunit beta [Solobacterium sp.]MCH4074250.1 DNA polymerase III subunit beta [Solobacterium sp.]MCI1313553.1 DNA polymerase III subunit beta [Solobacterium sp.]MCI1345739.1 DNA polymerase III subunit beta [Solobacterium sp.]
MKFSIAKTKMYAALQDVNHAISSTSPAALRGILIEASEDNELVLTASDNDVTIRRTLKGKDDEELQLNVEEPGSVVIDAHYIMDIVHKIDADTVKVEILDGALTSFKGNQAQFRINGTKADEYPDIDLSEPQQSFSVNELKLSALIEATAFAASDQETRPALTGIHMVLKEGKLIAVATDSYRLARKEEAIDSDLDIAVTIPAKSMNEVRSILLSEDKDIRIALDSRKAQFITDDTVFQTRLLEGAFPETDRLIPTSFISTLTISRSSLINVLDRSMFIKNENMTINHLHCTQNDIIFSNRSQEIGEFEQSLIEEGAVFKGEPLDISFNGGYVMAAARALKGNTIEIRFAGEMKPFILINPEDESMLQLTLPVRSYD